MTKHLYSCAFSFHEMLENLIRPKDRKKHTGLLAVSALLMNSSGCYFIFGPVCPKPEQYIQPTEFCMNRDMPKEWRSKTTAKPVMFEGPNSGNGGSCYYQTGESRFFEVDNKGFTWNVNCNGTPIWIDQYYSGHGVNKPWEIYAASVKHRKGHE